MSVFASQMTGKGTGAIATIQIFGDYVCDILSQIFVSQTQKPAEFQKGKILVGLIQQKDKTIDQVTIGCEDNGIFTINCHGNPLIIEEIMQLLKKSGVKLITAEQFIFKTSVVNNSIALEARLKLPKAKSIEGTKLILNQTESGLTACAKKWLENWSQEYIPEIKQIIEASHKAKHIIFGCKIVLTGPPNTGKSTLFNRLAGKEKAIVTNIKGTTRDWVSLECKIGSMPVELFDTAGLDETLLNEIDKASQQAALDIINQADLILFVLDNNQSSEQLIKNMSSKKVLTVLNKSDLTDRFKTGRAGLAPPNGGVNPTLQNIINISAKLGTGIDQLCDKIQRLTGIGKKFYTNQPVCFTSRQEELLTRLVKADSRDKAQTIITELLSGSVNV